MFTHTHNQRKNIFKTRHSQYFIRLDNRIEVLLAFGHMQLEVIFLTERIPHYRELLKQNMKYSIHGSEMARGYGNHRKIHISTKALNQRWVVDGI